MLTNTPITIHCMNETYGERVRRLREAAKLKPEEAGAAIGISRTAWSFVESGRSGQFTSDNAVKAAKILQVSVEELVTGKKPPTQYVATPSIVDGRFPRPTVEAREPSAANYLRNVERAAEIDRKGLVPLISWIQAGAWSTVEDPFATGDAEDWLPCPVRHGVRTYCLRVRGESMKNPDGKPSYDHGDIIYVDPDQEGLSGHRIITRLDDGLEATFKQLVEEDGKRLLKALNPDWTPRYLELNVDATYCGKVIGKWVPE